MGKEILAVPETRLREVIRVIRAGLAGLKSTPTDVSDEVRDNLNQWCDDEEEYAERLGY